MKKLTSCLLGIVLCFSLIAIPASAARDTLLEETLAGKLKTLNLFKGVSETDFDLNRAPNRTEALVMLIRVLGKEDEALSGTWSHPFKDVVQWAEKYVGYAYVNGLTNGISATEFGTSNVAEANMYITFVLRALGYSDANNLDFNWADPYPLARHIGILPTCVNIDNFWRSDVVTVSYSALPVTLKDGSQTLAQKLISAGVFTQTQYLISYDKTIIDDYINGTPCYERLTYKTRDEFHNAVADAKEAYEKGHDKTYENLEEIEWYFDFKDTVEDVVLNEIRIMPIYIAISYHAKEEIDAVPLLIKVFRVNEADANEWIESYRDNDTIDIVINGKKIMKKEVYWDGAFWDNEHIVTEYFWLEDGYAVQLNIPPWLLERYPEETFFSIQKVSVPTVG